MKAPIPAREGERLAELRRYQVLDTPDEPGFDRITALAARLFEVPIALVSLVDTHRQWFKSCVGLVGREIHRDFAFCAHAILADEPLVIPDTWLDPRFAENPLVTGSPHIRFYAGAVLTTPSGFNLGTLCLADLRPRELAERDVATLADLAQLVASELELRQASRTQKAAELSLEVSERALADRVHILEVILDSAGEGIVVADAQARFTVFNAAARRIVGLGPTSEPVSEWPKAYGTFEPDGSAPFPAEELPLARALRGESSDRVELLIRPVHTESKGTLVSITGRPLQDENGTHAGGVITFNDITALRAAENALARLAVTDQLTGLPNRRALDERLRLLVAEGGRGRRFAVVLADVDHFKKVNDQHGHTVGDEVLVHVARTLQISVRCTDLVARYGGEEFCILFSDVDEGLAVRLSNNLRQAVAQTEGPVQVTSSFGVCTNRPNERTDAAALLRAADGALYAAKRRGRNCVVAAALPLHDSLPITSQLEAQA